MKVLNCARSYSKSFMPTLINVRPKNRNLTDTTQLVNLVHSADSMLSMIPEYNPKRLGRMQRKAIMILCYGGGVQRAVKASGLSLRRVKVIAKQLTRY